MRSLSLFVLLLTACSTDGSDRSSAAASEVPRSTDGTRSASPSNPPDSATARRPVSAPRADTAIVRGIYVNRWAAQSPKKMRSLITLADTTEVNAFVIDIKD